MTPDGSDLIVTVQAFPDVEYQYKFCRWKKGKWFCDATATTITTDEGDTHNTFTIELYNLLFPRSLFTS
jgi:hypothetical protein